MAGVPKGWLNCPKSSNDIIGDIFYAFKTPYSHPFSESEAGQKWDIKSVIKSLKSLKKGKIGLWIDFTFTTRYFKKSDIESLGIKYIKIEMRGHGEEPPQKICNQFIAICSEFLSSSPERNLIGVHCTHGFNRTGYMICLYLMKKLNLTPLEAVEEFRRCRPPGIYRQNYVDALFQNCSVSPPQVLLPTWDTDTDSRSNKFNGINKELFIPELHGVRLVTQNEHKIAILSQVFRLLNPKSKTSKIIKKTGIRSYIPLTKSNLNSLTSDYSFSTVGPGFRCLLFIRAPNQIYFITPPSHQVYQVRNMTFPDASNLYEHQIKCTLIEGQMENVKLVRPYDNSSSTPHMSLSFIMQDIIAYRSNSVENLNYHQRTQIIINNICKPRMAALRAGYIDTRDEAKFLIRYQFSRPLFRFITRSPSLPPSSTFTSEYSCVFTHQNGSQIDSCPVFIWKDPTKSSNSFHLIVEVDNKNTEVMLYAAQTWTPFGKAELSDDLKKLHGGIGEFKYDADTELFTLIGPSSNVPFSLSEAEDVKNKLLVNLDPVTSSTRHEEMITKEELIEYIHQLTCPNSDFTLVNKKRKLTEQ